MSDGQFSSKPVRSGPKTDLTVGYPAGSGPLSLDQTRAFLESRAVQREIDALLDETRLSAERPHCAPLPNAMPLAAEEMGQPIASAVLVQEYLIGLIFLRVCGWIFLSLGVMFMVMAAVALIEAIRNGFPRGGPPFVVIPVMGAIGLGIAAAGAWFGYFRGRVITERCWLCTHGVVWMTERLFDWYTWADVPEVYCNAYSPRPAIGIRFDRNLSWISFSDTRTARRMVQHVEYRASAVRMQAVLRLLAQGSTISFGDARLNRQWLEFQQERFEWRQIAGVDLDDRRLVLRGYDGQDQMAIQLEEIAFPSLVAALAKAIIAHSRERPSW